MVLEDDRDDRQPLNGLRAQRVQARDTVDGVLDGQGHELFDFGRRQAGRLGLDDDLRRRELREDVEPRLPHGDNAGP